MPRPNRDETYSSPTGYSYQAFKPDGSSNGSGTVSTGSKVTLKIIDKTESVNTPNFEVEKRWNRLPINGYRYSRYVMSDPLGNKTQMNRDGGYTTYFQFTNNTQNYRPILVQDLSIYTDDPTQKAISRLISEIGTAKADLGTTVAELGKTAAHLAHTATRIYSALSALRKGRFGDFASAIGVSYTTRDVSIYNKRYARAAC